MKSILFFFFLFFQISLYAQIENVIVETYYISDANDASDTTGGKLEAGSITYRVYIDLAKGNKLTKIYGDANHTLKFSSTATFFNNNVEGQIFAKDINNNHLKDNTTALDTWLTLGQVATTNTKSKKTYFGILKSQDNDGSILGKNGLLTNTETALGIPLITADGLEALLVTMDPTKWNDNGISDSSIFGSIKFDSQYISNNAYLLYANGVTGINPDSNQILVAQLTTKGKISFKLNIVVIDSTGTTINYVADGRDTIFKDYQGKILSIEKHSNFLTYPPLAPVCGCMNSNYKEYDKSFTCGDSSNTYCKTLVVLGCMDPLACNYDPKANFPVQSLCCYPGYCQDRDISLVCPNLSIDEQFVTLGFMIYPNPAKDHLEIQIASQTNQKSQYAIYDSFGRVLFESNVNAVSGNQIQQVNISNLANGLYLFRLTIEGKSATKIFIKN